MRCLWLTLADPDPPLSGQSVYSGGLIRSCAGSGAEMVVLGLCPLGGRPRRDERDGNIRWWIPEGRELPRWSSMATLLPHMANRCRTRNMRTGLDAYLAENEWDAIVFDSISSAWALPAIHRQYRGNRKRPRIVYVSHNHESSLRSHLAENRSSFVMRQAHRLDAYKTRRLEHALVDSANLVTAITEEDGERYRAEWPKKRIEVLPPGYSGRTLPERQITNDVPRRAVIVGTFDWVAKRINLEEFLDVADPMFAHAGIELKVVGAGDPSYFSRLQSRLSATRFTGTVEHIEQFIDDARIAVVPERIGGGFKIKLLEYVFNRIPVLGLKGSVAGTPLEEEASVLLYANQAELASGVSRMIDDLSLLNRLQNAAYAVCRYAFDWESRGRQLMNALASS